MNININLSSEFFYAKYNLYTSIIFVFFIKKNAHIILFILLINLYVMFYF